MSAKSRLILGAVILVVILSVLVNGQTRSYEDFLKDFITEKANLIKQDAEQFETILDQWKEGEITQSTVVAKLQEMETRADSYFEAVLKLPAPMDKFDKYKQSIYTFVTWYNIIGIFADGMADLNMSKLDAAVVLSNYFEAKTEQFDDELTPTE